MNLQLQLERRSDIPLQDQVFEQLRQMIVSGALKPNTRIIATRFLAEQIGVSRTTVLLAYERLIAEGYLETRPAVGTFVAETPPETVAKAKMVLPHEAVERQSARAPAQFHTHARRHLDAPEGAIDFSPHRFEKSQLLPPKLWLKGIRNVFEAAGEDISTPPPPAGLRSLRQAIADHVAATRGIAASPEQVIIVDGRQQACNFIAHLFQRRSDRIVLECPCDEHIEAFFAARGAELSPVPVDEDGLDTRHLPSGPVSLACVAPARQNPLGGTMPMARRQELIEWARGSGCYIIEDDSDGELRYFGTQPPPLMALDPYGLVFFVGSFAKTLGAGLGLAYMIVPPEFVDAILAIKTFAEGGRQWLEQMVVADLLASGQYDHHLRRLRRQNLERRDTLISGLKTLLDDARLIGTEVGVQLSWILPDHISPIADLCARARERGVILKAAAASTFRPANSGGLQERALLFEYALLRTEQIRHGVARLGDAVRA